MAGIYVQSTDYVYDVYYVYTILYSVVMSYGCPTHHQHTRIYHLCKMCRYLYIVYTYYIKLCNIKVPHHRRHRFSPPTHSIRFTGVGKVIKVCVCTLSSVKNRLFKFWNVFAFRNYRSKSKSNRKTLKYIFYIPSYMYNTYIIRMCVSIHVTYTTLVVYGILCVVVKTIE